MKKLIFIILIMTAYIYSQSWNSTVTTSVYEPNIVKMDLFTNRDGNHIVVQNSNSSNSIKYYLLNSSGSVIRSATIETSSVAEFPNISGENDKVYIVYKLGSNLKLKKSTNAGQSWTTLNNQGIGSNTCNGVDITYNIVGLHVVYAMQDNGSNYETYYRLVDGDTWGSREDVTDYGSEVGGFPSVAVSSNRVHVAYNSGSSPEPLNNQGDAKTRDKNGSTWENPQTVSSGANNLSGAEKLQVRSSTLFDFYFLFVSGMGNYRYDLYYKTRSVSGTLWSSGSSIAGSVDITAFIGAETTADQRLHIFYYDEDNLYHRSYLTSWSGTYTIASYPNTPYNTTVGFNKVSNDLFCAWKPGNGNYLSYRQYDALPLPPQNLSVEIYSEGGETYPKLTWLFNYEPDVFIKTNAFQVSRRYSLSGGAWSGWYIIGYSDGDENQYIDYTIGGLYSEANTAEYKLKVRDYNNHFSDYSSSVSINFSHFNKVNSGIVNYDYKLDQNYPNPFNPATTISYSVKKTEWVLLKVYDILGNEVASLVDEIKEPGTYSLVFNASELPSGIYFYTLNSGNFMNTKKLILLK